MKNFCTAFAGYLFILFILTGFQKVQAQETLAVVKQPLAQFKNYGDHVDLEFADGRVARLMLSERVRKPQLKTKLQVIENVCTPEIISGDCEWTFDYIEARIAFLWVIHPDSTKLNQVVKLKTTTVTAPYPPTVTERLLEGNALNIIHHFLFKEKFPMVLSCTDDRWLQPLFQKSSQKFIVPSWSSEAMNPNDITNKNENMSSLQLNNSELMSLGGGRYELNITDKTASMFSRVTTLQETQTMYFLQESKQCSVQLKNSLDEIRKLQPDDPNTFLSHEPAVLPKDIPRALTTDSAFQIGAALRVPKANETFEAE